MTKKAAYAINALSYKIFGAKEYKKQVIKTLRSAVINIDNDFSAVHKRNSMKDELLTNLILKVNRQSKEQLEICLGVIDHELKILASDTKDKSDDYYPFGMNNYRLHKKSNHRPVQEHKRFSVDYSI